jgi:uncharacterized DUF497 family protein
MTLVYHFDWDANKARSNQHKHEVSFRLATTVFKDPLALTIYDGGHSEDEERWVTLGRAENGQYLVVVHMSARRGATAIKVRIISARKADRDEVRDYEETPR